jgi:hypothetical protein
MKTKTRAICLLILAGLVSSNARADGKFYQIHEAVPPDIPYQRAFLLFDEGTETLVVQSKYELTQSAKTESLAWVVPTPSVPELASMPGGQAWLFFDTAARHSQPSLVHFSAFVPIVFAVLFVIGVVLLLVCLVQYPFVRTGKIARVSWDRRCSRGVAVTVFGFLLLGITMPTLSTSASLGNVEIIKTERVGIYDVTVVRGDDAEPVLAWLRENKFAFGDEDKAVFADYVARGWCFVTAKVNPHVDGEKQRVTAEGLVAPLVLTFPTDRTVYPLALTAVAGAKTEILIYTLTPQKLTCGGRLPLRDARAIPSGRVLERLWVMTGPDEFGLMEGLPDKAMMLCKFKGTMTAAQMREDLVFETAPDNAAYRETEWVW